MPISKPKRRVLGPIGVFGAFEFGPRHHSYAPKWCIARYVLLLTQPSHTLGAPLPTGCMERGSGGLAW